MTIVVGYSPDAYGRAAVEHAAAEAVERHERLVVVNATSGQSLVDPGFAGEADALVTAEKDLCLSVAVADCVPVALVGEREVGMVHSGWRGTLSGVSGKAAHCLGGGRVQAYIGPSIRRCCYEVSAELASEFAGQRLVVVHDGRVELPHQALIDHWPTLRSWLDDDAVNAWYNILVEEKKKMMGYVKSDTNPPVLANLQSAWYAKYQKEKAKGLKRWLKRAGVGGTNMLKCERIFLPINTGNHWTLLIINGANRSIEYLDSLGGSGTRYFEIARDLLKSELGADYHEKEWMDLKRNRSSRQSNMDDCGVFTCMNGLAAAKDNPYKEVTAEQMPDARIMMAAVFFNKGFKDVVWW